MKTSCLINNYNYRDYILKAVDSALSQSVPFDEIIIVDDGSTDDSLTLLKEAYGHQPNITIISKPNEGQLSCFNQGFLASTGDIVFFLDADDLYESNYLEEVLKFYSSHPSCDFLFCAVREFGCSDRIDSPYPVDSDLGYSFVSTLYLKRWIGSPTSALSMRREILSKILPLPDVEEWRTRADDCLVWGASLMGARKYYLAQPFIRYRVHQKNNWYGKRLNAAQKFRRQILVNRLFYYFMDKTDVLHEWTDRLKLTYLEFRTIENPTRRNLKDYLKIIRKIRANRIEKVEARFKIILHYYYRKNGGKKPA